MGGRVEVSWSEVEGLTEAVTIEEGREEEEEKRGGR